MGRGTRPGPAAATALQLAADSYLTDGRRLLRVVAPYDPGTKATFAALEDCLSLEVYAYSPDELAALELRPIDMTGSG